MAVKKHLRRVAIVYLCDMCPLRIHCLAVVSLHSRQNTGILINPLARHVGHLQSDVVTPAVSPLSPSEESAKNHVVSTPVEATVVCAAWCALCAVHGMRCASCLWCYAVRVLRAVLCGGTAATSQFGKCGRVSPPVPPPKKKYFWHLNAASG